MTPDETEQRITLSRRTLADWIAVGSDETADEVLSRVHHEMLILEALAEEHPGKVRQLMALVEEWAAFQKRLRTKLN